MEILPISVKNKDVYTYDNDTYEKEHDLNTEKYTFLRKLWGLLSLKSKYNCFSRSLILESGTLVTEMKNFSGFDSVSPGTLAFQIIYWR